MILEDNVGLLESNLLWTGSDLSRYEFFEL